MQHFIVKIKAPIYTNYPKIFHIFMNYLPFFLVGLVLAQNFGTQKS